MKNILEFFKAVDVMPKKKKQKFVKQFVGNDRNLVLKMAELSKTEPEEVLIKKWINS